MKCLAVQGGISYLTERAPGGKKKTQSIMSILLSSRKRIVFIVNPNAAMGSVGKTWPRIKALAENRVGRFQAYFTEGPEHATVLTRHALEKGAGAVICVGGDGTLNEVVNGFMDKGGPIRPEAVLGFIPQGTGCDFARTVQIPKDPDRAIDLIMKTDPSPLDLGRITYRDHEGSQSVRYFHNVTSFGLGGEVDERVNRTSKVLGGFISFIWATLISVLFYDKKHIRLKVDDHFDETVVSWNVAVANGQYHGGGMQVAPEARVDDGLFHVTVVGDLTLAQVFMNLHTLYNGQILKVDKVSGMTGRRVEAASGQRVLLDVDGEQSGVLPVTIEMVTEAILFIKP